MAWVNAMIKIDGTLLERNHPCSARTFGFSGSFQNKTSTRDAEIAVPSVAQELFVAKTQFQSLFRSNQLLNPNGPGTLPHRLCYRMPQ
jgi:hypothetical protein